MKFDKEQLLLYAITDRTWLGDHTLVAQVEEALKGGVTCVQLREKDRKPSQFLQEAILIHSLCRRYQVPLIINDNVKIALQCNAEGVHVGQDDMQAGDVRRKIGPDKILGVSAHTVQEALQAQQQGADYLGCGAVFPTGSKSNVQVLDHQLLRDICNAVNIPVIAIGGISRENVLQLAGSGISGIAVISALFAQPDIRSAAQALCTCSREVVQG